MCRGMNWQLTLKELLADGAYATQQALVRDLEGLGHSVNQATVSRALRRLGVRKVGGVYQAPSAGVGPVHDASFAPGGGGLVVFHTNPAFASVVAQRIDRSGIGGVLGTIAGDDTVFAAVTDASVAVLLADLLGVELRSP